MLLHHVKRARARRRATITTGLVVVCTVMAIGGCASSSANSGSGKTGKPGPITKISIVSGGVVGGDAAIYIAQVEGYFKAEGLDVSILPSTGNTVNDVLSGQSDLALVGGLNAFGPVSSGKDTSIIYNAASGLDSAYIATGNPGITNLSQCKVFGTSPAGSGAYALTQFFMTSTHSHWRQVIVPNLPALLAELESGRYDCALSPYSTFQPGIAAGKLRLIVNALKPSTFPAGTYQLIRPTVGVSLWGLTSHVKAITPALTKLLKAVNKGVQKFETSSNAVVASILAKSPDWAATSPSDIAAEVQAERGIIAPDGGYIDPKSWPAFLALAKATLPDVDPASAEWAYGQRVDMAPYIAANGKPS